VPEQNSTTVRLGSREVRLTNLDKIFFPAVGLTKGDLIKYYLDMAPHVLNQASRQPMQMLRWPNGVEGEFFYQKESSMQKEHTSADTGGRRCSTPTIATAEIELDPIFERYKTRLVNRGRKPQTIANFVRSVAPFQRWIEERGMALADVDEETLESYFSPANSKALGYSNGTRADCTPSRSRLRSSTRTGRVTSPPTRRRTSLRRNGGRSRHHRRDLRVGRSQRAGSLLRRRGRRRPAQGDPQALRGRPTRHLAASFGRSAARRLRRVRGVTACQTEA
jgi:hypothetical protein